MKTRLTPWLLVILSLGGLTITASLIGGLRHALRRREKSASGSGLTSAEAERKRIHEALGDLLAPPIDYSLYPPHLRPGPDLPDRDTLRAMLPKLDPPLSKTIADERDEGRY